jgi:hypothetical protein
MWLGETSAWPGLPRAVSPEPLLFFYGSPVSDSFPGPGTGWGLLCCAFPRLCHYVCLSSVASALSHLLQAHAQPLCGGSGVASPACTSILQFYCLSDDLMGVCCCPNSAGLEPGQSSLPPFLRVASFQFCCSYQRATCRPPSRMYSVSVPKYSDVYVTYMLWGSQTKNHLCQNGVCSLLGEADIGQVIT